jgi:hypothetical protein
MAARGESRMVRLARLHSYEAKVSSVLHGRRAEVAELRQRGTENGKERLKRIGPRPSDIRKQAMILNS